MRRLGGIWIPEGEEHLAKHLEARPDYAATYDELRLERALALPRRRRAIDVGANVGLVSRRLAGRFELVEAFEPYDQAAACFRRNVRAKNVRLHRCALGESEGRIDLNVKTGTTLKTHISSGRPGYGLTEIRTLDSFFFECVDFIKVDCEGFDFFVLRGARATLDRCRPAVLFEAKPKVSRKRYGIAQDAPLRFLERLGYRLELEDNGNFFMRPC